MAAGQQRQPVQSLARERAIAEHMAQLGIQLRSVRRIAREITFDVACPHRRESVSSSEDA